MKALIKALKKTLEFLFHIMSLYLTLMTLFYVLWAVFSSFIPTSNFISIYLINVSCSISLGLFISLRHNSKAFYPAAILFGFSSLYSTEFLSSLVVTISLNLSYLLSAHRLRKRQNEEELIFL